MSSYTFRRAVREQVPLIIGLSGGTGSGKTMSAMRLAKGMAHGNPFCVIDTENGRASHYADQFAFDVLDLRAPFSPDAYAEAIGAADKAGYPVIVVDSMSHVWAGEGGVLDWQESELDRMAGDDWKRREGCKMAAWIKPKMAHKHMMQTLLQVKAHLILAFRAEEKIEMVRIDGKMEVRKKDTLIGKDGWVPICEKNVPFEATCSFLLLASNPGMPHPIKLQEQHKAFFGPDQCIDEQSGEQLAQWAAGGAPKPLGAAPIAPPEAKPPMHAAKAHPAVTTVPARHAPMPSPDEHIPLVPPSAPVPTPSQASAFIWQVGKTHGGKRIEDIPMDYLQWYVANGKKADHVAACQAELARVAAQKPATLSALCEAYLENIAASETVVECDRAIQAGLTDEHINVFEGQQLKDAGARKIALLRVVSSRVLAGNANNE